MARTSLLLQVQLCTFPAGHTAVYSREHLFTDPFYADCQIRFASVTLSVGDPVEVQAFGRIRPGVVVGIGSSKVRVLYARNSSGEKHERAFAAAEFAPSVFDAAARV